MSKEVEVAESPLRRTMFSAELYKRSQGRITRQATFGALALIVALGVYALHYQLDGVELNVRYIIDAVVLCVGLWMSFRLVNMPRFADFLISVEAEMTKVSWPSKTDLIRTSVVVMIVIFGLAALLYAYDLIWQAVLRGLGILG
ncbi:MAG: preprotein translocase subunit SecE [Planctomycetaceae bacterium]|nr:preprotein translocase subunit SecE [Planctomycetaceae bacterium]